MTNFSKIEKKLSNNILLADQKKDLKGGSCPLPPSGGSKYSCNYVVFKKFPLG